MLEEVLRGSSMLLVLDNFEHVIEATTLVTRLVQHAPDVRVLATSRARLRVAGERVFDVEPLGVDTRSDPAGHSDAVRLFEQAATHLDPGFRLDVSIDDVIDICRSVAGLPLAIEVAAGHLRTLPPAVLRSRLGSLLDSPIGAPRDAPERQQTIPATIDWSLQLLGDEERRLFARLGIFNGPVPLEAIERDLRRPRRRRGATEQARGPEPGQASGERPARASLRPAGAGQGPRTRSARQRPGRPGRLGTRRTSPTSWKTWTNDAGRVRPTAGSTTSPKCLPRSGPPTTGRTEHDQPDVAARIAASLGTYWHLDGHHAEGRQWVEQALATDDRARRVDQCRARAGSGFRALAGRPAGRALALGARRREVPRRSATPGCSPSRCPRPPPPTSGTPNTSTWRSGSVTRASQLSRAGGRRSTDRPGAQRPWRADPRSPVATTWPARRTRRDANSRSPPATTPTSACSWPTSPTSPSTTATTTRRVGWAARRCDSPRPRGVA